MHTGDEVRVRAAPGDYVFVPPHTPHREENNDPDTEHAARFDRIYRRSVTGEIRLRSQDGFHADVWSQTGSVLGSRTTTAVSVDRRRA
jgi:uncharacterized RmlC-like cupin family protein